MIKYRLGCPSGHEFESWFRTGADFDVLVAKGHVSCPECKSTVIEKLPMAPALISRKAPVKAHRPEPQAEVGRDEIVKQLRAFKQKVVENSEDVGVRFADEARKIHYGESEERNIRGASTAEEARGLAEEGIPFGVLPELPEDQN